jgi:hypothetical protein
MLCGFQLTFGSFIAVDEKLSYQPHPEDRNKTLLKQEAVVTVQGIPLNSYMEDILTNTIMANANKVGGHCSQIISSYFQNHNSII